MSTIVLTPFPFHGDILFPSCRNAVLNKWFADCASVGCRPNVNETETHINLTLDVPGVRHDDIKVELDNDSLAITGIRRVSSAQDPIPFKRAFQVDTSTVDTNLLKAILADGVLIISAPKLPKEEAVPVLVNQCEHVFVDDDELLQITVEVPGVKLDDINVVLDGGVLRVVGERKSGSSETTFREYTLDASTYDLTSLVANLSDGLLVVTISKKEIKEPRDIEVEYTAQQSSDNREEEEASVPTEKVAEISVETVDEEAEAVETEAAHKGDASSSEGEGWEKLD